MLPLTACYVALLAILTYLADTGGMREVLLKIHSVPWGDKALHFLLVGVLALLVNLTIRTHWRPRRWLSLVPGTLLVALVGTAEECSNVLVATRNWSPADLAANLLGVVCVGVVPLTVYARRSALEPMALATGDSGQARR